MTDQAPPPDTAVTVHHDAAAPVLRPADPQDVLHAMAFALRYQGRRRVDTAGEMMARIAAERIAEHLARSGFVVMRRPEQPLGPGRHYGPNVPTKGDASWFSRCHVARQLGIHARSRIGMAELLGSPA